MGFNSGFKGLSSSSNNEEGAYMLRKNSNKEDRQQKWEHAHQN